MITRTRRARPTTPSPADYLGDTPHQAILPRPWATITEDLPQMLTTLPPEDQLDRRAAR
jgi:hypothetical protein